MDSKTSNFYALLEVPKSATPAEIKSSYKKLALKWHPDKHKEEDREKATETFKLISEAYSVLSNEKRRAYYDKYGTTEGVDEEFDVNNLDSFFEFMFDSGSGDGFMDDMEQFIRILESESDKAFKQMFKGLGKGYRGKPSGRSRKQTRFDKQMKKSMKEMGNIEVELGLGGSMEEMMMMAMMSEAMGADDDMDFDEFEKMMSSKSKTGKKKKADSGDSWESVSDDDGKDKGVVIDEKDAGSDDDWETDSN